MEKTNLVLTESQYPLPSESQVMVVTPEMASDWMTHREYDRNRRPSRSVTGKYKNDMEAGRWKVARNAGLIFDTYGKVIDGGNRLTSLANCDPEVLQQRYGVKGVAFWVYVDEPRDTFEVLDQGYKRQAAHLLGVPNSTTVAAAGRYLAALSDQDRWSMPRFPRVSNPEIYATVKAWPELSRYTVAAQEIRIATWIISSAHLAVLAQASRTELGTTEKIESWRTGLLTGDNLSAQDPRLQLRNRFIRQHQHLSGSKNRDLVYNLITKAWNAYVNGQGMQVLRWVPSEGIVSVSGFDWSKHNSDKEA